MNRTVVEEANTSTCFKMFLKKEKHKHMHVLSKHRLFAKRDVSHTLIGNVAGGREYKSCHQGLHVIKLT